MRRHQAIYFLNRFSLLAFWSLGPSLSSSFSLFYSIFLVLFMLFDENTVGLDSKLHQPAAENDRATQYRVLPCKTYGFLLGIIEKQPVPEFLSSMSA